jgi:signal recognition particle subunit SRP72
LESDNPSDLASAGELFSSLLAANPSDLNAVAGIVASYATTDPSKISNHTETLTSVEKLIAGIDASSLESAGVAQPPRKRGAEDDATPSTKTKKIRKKKPRLPQNHDPSKKPDLERWLPMRDRSYYKPKGRKGKQKAAAATQGGPVEESMELAGGGRIDVVKVDQAKKAGGGGGANKKKKKKGGKW